MKTAKRVRVANVRADTAVRRFGADLVGMVVKTKSMGKWLGGECTVIELQPDPNAPEIVFQVHHPDNGDIGIFEWERVTVYSSTGGV